MKKTCEELMKACKSNRKDKEYWLQLHKEVHDFLDGDNPEEQKSMLRVGLYVECVDMMYLAFKG